MSARLDNICDVPGVLVGHATDIEVGITGCTTVLFERPATVGVDVRGASPGTRETARLSPTSSIRHTHAVVLTGGSAFGLAAADGVVRYLEESGVGLDVGVAKVPLVSAAVLFDLALGDPSVRPDAGMGYAAATAAESGDFDQGNAGAGTGATVGKILGMERAMKSGVGSASFVFEDGLVVAALVVPNALGEVRDPATGLTLAGPRQDDGSFADTVEKLREAEMLWGRNTTLGVVATNAALTKAEATKIAQMSHDGLARSISPIHTSVDGDTIFAASLGEVEAAPDVVGAWAARAVSESVVRAVKSAESVAGVPGLAGGE